MNDTAPDPVAPTASTDAPAVDARPVAPTASTHPEVHAPADTPLTGKDSPALTADTPAQVTGWLVSLMVAASMMMVIWNLQDSSLTNANTGSRYATIESLVDYGTFYIDKSRYVRTIDKVKVGKHYLSSKPPTLPAYGALVYKAYQAATGKTIADHEGDVVRCVSLFTGGLFHLIFLTFLYRLAKLLLTRQLAILALMAAGCFSYLGVAYATAINNHSIGASLLMVALYYAYRLRHGLAVDGRHWVLCGLILGLLTAVDLPSGAFIPLVGIYLAQVDLRRTLLYFAPALLPGLMCQLGLGYLTTGSIEPAYFNKALKEFDGNYFKGNQSGIDALREPKHIYAFNTLLGHHGLFSMTPLLGFGLWELVRSLRKRIHFAESCMFAAGILAILGFYIFRTRNYGGWCVGMRHIVPLMPLFLLYFALLLDRVRITKPLWGVVVVCFSIGAFNVQDGLTSPFQFSVWHNFLDGTPNRGRIGREFNLGRAYKKAHRSKSRPKATRSKQKSSAR